MVYSLPETGAKLPLLLLQPALLSCNELTYALTSARPSLARPGCSPDAPTPSGTQRSPGWASELQIRESEHKLSTHVHPSADNELTGGLKGQQTHGQTLLIRCSVHSLNTRLNGRGQHGPQTAASSHEPHRRAAFQHSHDVTFASTGRWLCISCFPEASPHPCCSNCLMTVESGCTHQTSGETLSAGWVACVLGPRFSGKSLCLPCT